MYGSILIFGTCRLGTWPVLMFERMKKEQMRMQIHIVEDKNLTLIRIDSQGKKFPVFWFDRINLLQYH